ncbi:hypothetical protein SAMN05216227_10811 [Pseudorhodobacter antarcticus]|uniref:Uncharacterized protein n=1 Tax=Pseudorhodobacter antarcticus TaxID=1077947 RepID=A0A1H8NER7_9RHOB|nr:hypothetical protein SAMN05216227_10811 [Pseudorhodobacter antarcticus]
MALDYVANFLVNSDISAQCLETVPPSVVWPDAFVGYPYVLTYPFADLSAYHCGQFDRVSGWLSQCEEEGPRRLALNEIHQPNFNKMAMKRDYAVLASFHGSALRGYA